VAISCRRSAVTRHVCAQKLITWTGCSVAKAVGCVTAHPAKLLGIEDRNGSLMPGCDADLVVLNHNGKVYQTWKFGKLVYDVDERDRSKTETKRASSQ
jgi:N-acetylglucosamine-6-phosphate deacetylase